MMETSPLELFPDRDNYGTNALNTFLRACLSSVRSDLRNAALYALFAYHAGNLLESYHQTPLPASVSDSDYELFYSLIEKGKASLRGSDSERLVAINQIAAADFFDEHDTKGSK
jgi:hypothetical protein